MKDMSSTPANISLKARSRPSFWLRPAARLEVKIFCFACLWNAIPLTGDRMLWFLMPHKA
jgi:hypothetical protein